MGRKIGVVKLTTIREQLPDPDARSEAVATGYLVHVLPYFPTRRHARSTLTLRSCFMNCKVTLKFVPRD